MRRLALKIMQRFEEFNPYLVGAVLSGHPGTHCDITIQLYSDFQKELEIVLLNQRIEVSGQSRAVKLGERTFNVEIYSFDEEGVVINLHVFPKNAERLIPKNTDKRALDRARIRQLQELINQEDCNISAA
ncbi:MAG: hypothetical protein B7X47_00140 [Ferrovum sp. 34-44-207]|nr:MAG: hypothetical protein B7X47_00140 [Ferrovum sp. 34-44-207]